MTATSTTRSSSACSCPSDVSGRRPPYFHPAKGLHPFNVARITRERRRAAHQAPQRHETEHGPARSGRGLGETDRRRHAHRQNERAHAHARASHGPAPRVPPQAAARVDQRSPLAPMLARDQRRPRARSRWRVRSLMYSSSGASRRRCPRPSHAPGPRAALVTRCRFRFRCCLDWASY